MSISRELLMRYHDGELSEAEARAVEAAIEDEPALLDELEAYSELGSFVRAWDQAANSSTNTNGKLAAFDVTASVMAALEPPRARVHSLLPRIATWVSLSAAIAAGSVLVVRSWSAPPIAPPGAASGEHAERAMPSATATDLAAVLAAVGEELPKPSPATIESVDFGSNTGEVFVVSTDSSETPVVWMPDDAEPDEDNEDRSESL